jgi:hypothetical protein
MKIKLGRLRTLICEVTGDLDPDVAPPAAPAARGWFSDDDEFERDSAWELEWEAQQVGSQLADSWLSSGTDVDADEWIDTALVKHPDLNPELIRQAFDSKIDAKHGYVRQ